MGQPNRLHVPQESELYGPLQATPAETKSPARALRRRALTWVRVMVLVVVAALALVGIVFLLIPIDDAARERAGKVRAVIKPGLKYADVLDIATGARISRFGESVHGCVPRLPLDTAACRTLTIVFGEATSYSIHVSFDAQGLTTDVSDVEYVD
jgi:hypothetical protein